MRMPVLVFELNCVAKLISLRIYTVNFYRCWSNSNILTALSQFFYLYRKLLKAVAYSDRDRLTFEYRVFRIWGLMQPHDTFSL